MAWDRKLVNLGLTKLHRQSEKFQVIMDHLETVIKEWGKRRKAAAKKVCLIRLPL